MEEEPAISPLLNLVLEEHATRDQSLPDLRNVPDEVLTEKGKAIKTTQVAGQTPTSAAEVSPIAIPAAEKPASAQTPHSAAEVAAAVPAAEKPADFDAHQAMVALFGDNKRLVSLGYMRHELDELEEFDPAFDELPDETYEFTPATNLN